MDRLTIYIEGEAREDHSRDTRVWKNGDRDCMARLAAYEDTGLTPEEVTQVNDFVGSQLHKAMELNALLLKELAEVTTEKNAAIRTRERVMNKLSKQVAHTVRARHLRDEARAEAGRLREELDRYERAKSDGRLVEIPDLPQDMNNLLEPLKVQSALNSEIMKVNFRREHRPKDVSILDYTIIAALHSVLKSSLDAENGGTE